MAVEEEQCLTEGQFVRALPWYSVFQITPVVELCGVGVSHGAPSLSLHSSVATDPGYYFYGLFGHLVQPNDHVQTQVRGVRGVRKHFELFTFYLQRNWFLVCPNIAS